MKTKTRWKPITGLLIAVVAAAAVVALAYGRDSPAPPGGSAVRPVLSNTEDTPLRVSFAGADIVADKTALEKVVGSEWPRGTRLPTSGLKGNLADINKAGRVRWLSGNLISMEVGGVARDVWVFVPFDYGVQGDFAHNLDGAQVTSGVHGKPFLVQSRPDWWKNGFFVPAPSDAPYLLSAADLAYVPVIPPAAVRYQPVKDPQAVVDWLAARDSAEAGIEYLTMLDRAGKTYNINPLLLLAITGQEQSFVPKFLDDWPQVIRNPFNVFYSWQGYSPGFLPTAMIAAETVNRLSNGCPAGVNPIEWIDSPANPNDRYAGDTNWWKGVSVFFSILEKVGGG